MGITRRMMIAAGAGCLASPAHADDAPAAIVIHAGQGGRLTQDRDREGGNPFASALVAVLAEERLPLSRFRQRLGEENAQRSGGWQQLDAPKRLSDPAWRIDASANRVHRAMALVLINSDYSKSPGVYSLAGASVDAKRVPAALVRAGFETQVVENAALAEVRQALADFASQSTRAETALVYVGGHGLQHGRTVWWMMGDYPGQDARWLGSHAIALNEIARSARAARANLALYAGCRNDPFFKTR